MSTQLLSSQVEENAQTSCGPSFFEAQFPVRTLSKERYKERRAGAGQTITELGKWWGRKPLALVHAIILGLLLPATENPDADRETFLALMTMDDDGMLRRLDGTLSAQVVYELCTPRERATYVTFDGVKPAWRRDAPCDTPPQHTVRGIGYTLRAVASHV
jgi:putative DNA methylase